MKIIKLCTKFFVLFLLCFNLFAEDMYYVVIDQNGYFSCVLVTKEMMQKFKKENNYKNCDLYGSFELSSYVKLVCSRSATKPVDITQPPIETNIVKDIGKFKNKEIEKELSYERKEEIPILHRKKNCNDSIQWPNNRIKEILQRQKEKKGLGL